MKKIIRTFINNQAFPSCLIVVIKDEETTSIEKRNNVTVIYNQDEEIASATINVYQKEDIEKGVLNV